MEVPESDSTAANNVELAASPAVDTQSLSFLLSQEWWITAIVRAYRFAPNCIVCGLGIGILNLLVVTGTFFFEQKLRGLGTINDTSLALIFAFAIGALIGAVLITLASFWFVWLWLLRLTAFARAWLTWSAETEPATHFQACVKEIDGRRKYLGLVWLFASLYLIPTVIPLAILIALKILTGPEYSVNGEALVPLPAWAHGSTVHTVSIIVGALLSILAISYTLLMTTFSSVSQAPPFRIATQAFVVSLKHVGPIAIITIVVFAFNLFISAPQMVLSFSNIPVLLKENVWLSSALQIWMAITSLVLWPLSLAPFCEITRRGVSDGATNAE